MGRQSALEGSPGAPSIQPPPSDSPGCPCPHPSPGGRCPHLFSLSGIVCRVGCTCSEDRAIRKPVTSAQLGRLYLLFK